MRATHVSKIVRRRMQLAMVLSAWLPAAWHAFSQDVPARERKIEYAAASNFRYTQLAILSPNNESTVFNNNGTVNVALAISPALAAEDRIELFLDGKPVQRQADTQVTLSGVNRGFHELRARIVDAQGEALVESGVVRFYLWQASHLFPSRR